MTLSKVLISISGLKVELRTAFLAAGILLFTIANAQTPAEKAAARINTLKALMTQAENKGIDVLHEKTAIRTAEIFLKFADWDEAHQTENAESFALISRYKAISTETAALLPDFERNDVVKMLDTSIEKLSNIIDGKIFRKTAPQLDWTQISNVGNQLNFNNRACFPLDYTWKPSTTELTEYHGNLDGFYIGVNKVTSATGTLNSSFVNDLMAKPSGSLGFIFIGNSAAQAWTETAYGADFRLGAGVRYTEFDIDNPGALTMMRFLLQRVVPQAKGKKYSELGYMLCNEPHFYTTTTGSKLDWASGPVTNFTKEKFKIWLQTKHSTIAKLNALWGTNFASFNDVTIDIPIDVSLIGTPKWYDWNAFNNYRVTEWYKSLKSIIKEYDSNANVHLKLMPNLWTENKRGHGMDMEALTDMSEIIGNDCSTENAPMWGTYDWQKHYALEWRELFMGYDFYTSVSPNKVMLNSETHFLSTGKSRDLYQDPAYVRATFWAAHTLGLTANQVWLWGRNADGSINSKAGNGYAATNCQQPRVTNELHATMLDLNTFSEEIMAMQRQKKPLRIFYSETSALNKTAHMDDVFELYEKLNFDGISLGFATQNIISKQDNSLWNAILVYKTEFVTQAELNALQAYLNSGGTVIVDAVSLKKNEYGQALSTSLVAGAGTLISATTADLMRTKALEVIQSKGSMPELSITETNTGGAKGCAWKCVKNSAGNNVLSIVNLGKTEATLDIQLKYAIHGTSCNDLINGIPVSAKPNLKPYEVYFVEIIDKTNIVDSVAKLDSISEFMQLYPNPILDNFKLQFRDKRDNVSLKIYDVVGNVLFTKKYTNTDLINESISDFANGIYVLNVESDGKTQSVKLVKN